MMDLYRIQAKGWMQHTNRKPLRVYGKYAWLKRVEVYDLSSALHQDACLQYEVFDLLQENTTIESSLSAWAYAGCSSLDIKCYRCWEDSIDDLVRVLICLQDSCYPVLDYQCFAI